MRVLRALLPALLAAVALTQTGTAEAAGGNYRFDGGTKAQQAQVRQALRASSFDWSLVPGPVTIHITPRVSSSATPGEIWLDAHLLDSGRFSWGVVQHEYAHQVDFLLFSDEDRAQLQRALGGQAWCWDTQGLDHADYGCERFASTLAWAYWQNPDNCMRPDSQNRETSAMPAAKFRQLVKQLLSRS